MPLSFLTLALAVTLAIDMSAEVFVLRHAARQQIRIESLRWGVGLALFITGAMISLPVAAAAKLGEAAIAFSSTAGRCAGWSAGRQASWPTFTRKV